MAEAQPARAGTGGGWRLAVSLLTVLPCGGPAADPDRRTAGRAIALSPLVGVLLGLLAAGLLFAVRLADPPQVGTLLPAALAVAVLAGLTRGLHLDGVADTADGLASYRPPAAAREVMRQPEVGALGVVAVVLVLLLQVVALGGAVAAGRGTIAVLLACVAGRVAVVTACTPATPPAAATGLGALVAETVSPVTARLWVLAGAAAAGGMGAADRLWEAPVAGQALAVAAGRPVLALLAGLAAAALLRRHAVRRLGGISGDVLGALVELTATVVLVVMALGPAGS